MDKTHEKYAKKARTDLRKKDYQVADEALIKKILTHGSHGTLASTYNHQPFITPLIYIYNDKEHSVYFHGARTGRLRANLHFNPNIAFNVLEFGNILAHKEASEFNVAYNSVTIFGSARLIDDEKKAIKILNQLLKKYAPHLEMGEDYKAIQANEIKITAVYQIKIQDWTCKQQIETSEYQESFEYTPTKISKTNKQ